MLEALQASWARDVGQPLNTRQLAVLDKVAKAAAECGCGEQMCYHRCALLLGPACNHIWAEIWCTSKLGKIVQ